jgi:hypothetical protein
MSIDDILNSLSLIGNYSEDEVEKYRSFAEKNLMLVGNVEIHDEADWVRLDYLVAAKTNYEIALMKAGESNVTSFTAGDVSITESDSVNTAREIYYSALADASDLVGDNGFEFRSI